MLVIVLYDIEKKNMEFFIVFIGFDLNEVFVNVCLYCFDFDFDVLEIFINGVNFCVFLILKILMYVVFIVS